MRNFVYAFDADAKAPAEARPLWTVGPTELGVPVRSQDSTRDRSVIRCSTRPREPTPWRLPTPWRRLVDTARCRPRSWAACITGTNDAPPDVSSSAAPSTSGRVTCDRTRARRNVQARPASRSSGRSTPDAFATMTRHSAAPVSAKHSRHSQRSRHLSTSTRPAYVCPAFSASWERWLSVTSCRRLLALETHAKTRNPRRQVS